MKFVAFESALSALSTEAVDILVCLYSFYSKFLKMQLLFASTPKHAFITGPVAHMTRF